jgi:predicted alpha/beta superfamily hydrolase
MTMVIVGVKGIDGRVRRRPMADELPHREEVVVHAIYPRDRGRLTMRGGGSALDWHRDRAPDRVEGDVSTFHVPVVHGEPIELKLVRGDGAWMSGRNAVAGCGDVITLYPAFEGEQPPLEGWRSVDVPGGPMRFRVQLPPSYREQTSLRYPVIYAEDGQSLWSDSGDPFGTWQLDRVLDDLWDLGALAELIVVSIDTGTDRLDKLGPVADPKHGGGKGQAHLAAIVDVLKPLVDREYRTHPDRASTALLGASMGGLFSFWAAWTRPDVFGTAICLSSSFWWADRFLLRAVQSGACPAPRPRIYIDSGASSTGFEEDASMRDGVHNTRAMYRALLGHCYAPDDDLHVLAWPGQEHDPVSWSSRVAFPLQLLFPGRA